MVKPSKYEGFGDTLSTEVAFLQAASALDNAAIIAIKQDKSDELAQIAAVWMELGSRLMHPGPDEEKDGEEPDGDMTSSQPIGFAPFPEIDQDESEVAANGRTK